MFANQDVLPVLCDHLCWQLGQVTEASILENENNKIPENDTPFFLLDSSAVPAGSCDLFYRLRHLRRMSSKNGVGK